MATQDIGTGQTYTTRQAWEDSLAGTLLAAEISDCLGEAFTGALQMAGHVTTASFYMECRGKAGFRHDGRRNSVSGLGNARVAHAANAITTDIADEYVRYSWMEQIGPGNNGTDAVFVQAIAGTGSAIYIHHNIIGNDGASTSAANHGCRVNGTNGNVSVYRNYIFGFGGNGAQGQSAQASAFYNNTIYGNNRSNTAAGARAGIRGDDADFTYHNNAVFDNLITNFAENAGTFDYSATNSASPTGANSIGSLTTANQFENPTTTWASIDLRLKSGSALIGEGSDLSGTGLPEIATSIRGLAVTGNWDIGADQFVAAGSPFDPKPPVMVWFS